MGGIDLHSTTLKATFFPVNTLYTGKFSLHPLSVGSFLNYSFGKQYFLFTPNRYTVGYYGFSSALIMGFFMGGSAEYALKGKIRSAGIYYEVGTIDKYIASYIVNLESVPLNDIFSLAIGIKLGLGK